MISSPKVVIITGSGVSAPSNIPTFRNDNNGFWKKYETKKVCNVDTRKSKDHYDFMNMFRKIVLDSKPNEFHYLLSSLQNKFGEDRIKIYTSNIDNLHETSGSKVTHLHGSLDSFRCETCSHKYKLGLTYKLDGKELCDKGCANSFLRNDIILFGEYFGKEYDLLEDDTNNLGDQDLFIIVGNSLSIFPYDHLIKNKTCKSIYVSYDKIPSDIEKKFTVCIQDSCVSKEVLDTIEKETLNIFKSLEDLTNDLKL